MKKLVLSALAVYGAFTLTSCGGGETKTEEKKDSVMSVTYTIDAAASKLVWEGRSAFSKDYFHKGTIAITSGTLTVVGDSVSGGMLDLDMTKMNELEAKDSTKIQALIGHLSDSTFFDVAKYPTAKFEITSGKKGADGKWDLMGKLTVKDVTKEIMLKADIKTEGDNVSIELNTWVNRLDYNVKALSKTVDEKGAGQKAVNDTIWIMATLSGKK